MIVMDIFGPICVPALFRMHVLILAHQMAHQIVVCDLATRWLKSECDFTLQKSDVTVTNKYEAPETDGTIGIVSKSLILILILGISISIGIDWGLFWVPVSVPVSIGSFSESRYQSRYRLRGFLSFGGKFIQNLTDFHGKLKTLCSKSIGISISIDWGPGISISIGIDWGLLWVSVSVPVSIGGSSESRYQSRYRFRGSQSISIGISPEILVSSVSGRHVFCSAFRLLESWVRKHN